MSTGDLQSPDFRLETIGVDPMSGRLFAYDELSQIVHEIDAQGTIIPLNAPISLLMPDQIVAPGSIMTVEPGAATIRLDDGAEVLYAFLLINQRARIRGAGRHGLPACRRE